MPAVFLHAVLKIFRIQEKPAYRSFFIIQNISKTTNVFANHGHSFLRCSELYTRNQGSMAIRPGKILTRKIPTHQTPPWKIPPGENSACTIIINTKLSTKKCYWIRYWMYLTVPSITFILYNNPTLNNCFRFCK